MQSNERNEDQTMAEWIGFTREETNHRVPVLSDIERRAYQAAWRIDKEKAPEALNGLACASTRHARYIDHLARIIQEEMGR
jgi:hypothetical protein